MEKFNLDNFLERHFNFKPPVPEGSYVPFTKDKLSLLMEEIHEHYKNQNPIPEDYEGPELVTEEYAFKKQEEAEVHRLHNELGELGVVTNRLSELIGSRSYILAYNSPQGGVSYSIGSELTVKDMLYQNYILNQQVGLAFHNSQIGNPH